MKDVLTQEFVLVWGNSLIKVFASQTSTTIVSMSMHEWQSAGSPLTVTMHIPV